MQTSHGSPEFLPSMHAQGVKQLVLSVIISTKFSRSEDSGIWSVCKCNQIFGGLQIFVLCSSRLSTLPTADHVLSVRAHK